jgi:hypothetical protein
MKTALHSVLPLALLLFSVANVDAAETEKPPTKEAVEFFESRVRPVLAANCLTCHSEEKQKGGLRLDTRAAVLKGAKSGPVVTPGNPDKSVLIQAIRHEGKKKMPPTGKLPDDVIDALAAWVKMGVPWPQGTAGEVRIYPTAIADVRKTHWAFQPVVKAAAPIVKDEAWIQTPIDRFICAKLEAKDLTPAKPADRRTLIRRASFDVIGLPPTPEEIAAFEADRSPNAFQKIVDRLLASPQYGERWGRHWLDVARYSDTKGYVFQEERRYPYAYTYRDYVIRAFNEDLPYDQFIIQQLAADQLNLGEDKRALAAMGYLTLGRRFLNNQADIIDDRIDVVCRGLLGLTVSCARCHDHKFDPIPTKDYYSLYGVFANSMEPADLPLLKKPERTAAYDAFEKELQARELKVSDFIEASRLELSAKFRKRAGDYLLAAQHEPANPGARAESIGPDDLHPQMIRRWRTYVEESRTKHNAVLTAWIQFAKLPEKEFAAKSAEALKNVSEKGRQPINALVVKALTEKPPDSLAAVAKIYGELFAQADHRWQEAVAKAKELKMPPPPALADTDWEEVRLVLYGPGTPPAIQTEDVRKFIDRAGRDKLTGLRREVEQWKASSPAAPPRAMVLNDAPNPQDPHVLLRGNPNNLGEVVPRQFLMVLAGDKRQPFKEGSGRLELARAIASRDNPLTARVLVNRVWLHHFGSGLVRTPSDFGLRGEPPTHPELLDYLAAMFMEDGWSIKKLHRRIMLSSVYQQSSASDPKVTQADPENQLLSHMNRTRLEFEAMRDSLLYVAGRLDVEMGGPAVDELKQPFSARRTVYGFIDRQNLPGLLRTFDFASPDTSSPQRYTTTVPQQALFLMNSPFVSEQAKTLVSRPDVASLPDTAAKIKRLYHLAYGRQPEADELQLGLRFLEPEKGKPASASIWNEYAQVLLLGNEFAFVD